MKIYNQHEGYFLEAYDNNESRDLVAKIITNNRINSEGLFMIKQDSEGFDIDDRIERGNRLINSILSVT